MSPHWGKQGDMLRNFFDRLRLCSKPTRLPPLIDERAAISNILCRELKICGVCKQGMSSSHRFAKVASVIAGVSEQPNISQLTDAIVHKDWQLLTSFNEWNGDRDNLVAYVIACPAGGGILAQIYDPVELYESSHHYREQILTQEETRALSEFIPVARWNQL
jgi:hypothetical protein